MPDEMSASPPVREELDQDTKDLHAMGYAQELDRSMSKFSNFAVSFTIISILSGCLTLYGYGLLHGGPPVMLWGWLLVGTLVIFAGMSLGEICSSFPTAGGLYYWAAKLAPGDSAPIWSWFTGWFNLLGQVAVTAGISFGCAFSISAFMSILTGSATWLEPYATILILAVVLGLQGLLNTFSVRLVALLNDVSVYWHLIGVAIIFVLLFWAPESGTHQSVSFLFGTEGWKAFEGLSGFTIPLYVFLIGLLNAQYTFTGYDASAHVSEETIQARISAPKGIVNSIWISMIAGFILLLGVSMAIPTDLPGHHQRRRVHGLREHRRRPRAVGDHLRVRHRPHHRPHAHPHRHRGAVLLRHVVDHRQLAHGLRVLARRRGAVLGLLAPRQPQGPRPRAHRLVRRHRSVHPGAAVPVQHRRLRGRHVDRRHRPLHLVPHAGVPAPHQPGAFKPGPWVLSKTWGPIINWLAIIWVVFIVIVLMLPQYNAGVPWSADFSWTAFNYAPIAVLVVVGGAGLWYAVSARKWFKGPKVQGTAEELAEIEADLNVI